MEHKKLNFVDFFVYFLIVLISGLVLFIHFNNGVGNKAAIYINNKLVQIVSLKKNNIYSFDTKLGKYVVEVKDGKIGVKETHCSEKICQKMGFINHKGDEIICIPNRVLIKILGKGRVDDISR